MRRILVLGYGNPGRQDDGIGPEIAGRVEALGLPGVRADADYQLNIEDAAALAESDKVLFVDASLDAPEPYGFRKIAPSSEIAFTSHAVSPESILAVCDDAFRCAPEAFVLAVRGYAFDFEEGLSAAGGHNCEEAFSFVKTLLQTWRESDMESTTARKKMILTIDDDTDIRAALRMVLEAEGFTVGEAASGEEGVKIAGRINPDAIIVDLMMETVDAGAVATRKLKEQGFAGPIYMLSSAGDTVRYNLDARELGLSGIFQKPIDPKTLVTTLKAKLKI